MDDSSFYHETAQFTIICESYDNLAKLLIASLISLTCAVNDKFIWLVIFVTQLPHCHTHTNPQAGLTESPTSTKHTVHNHIMPTVLLCLSTYNKLSTAITVLQPTNSIIRPTQWNLLSSKCPVLNNQINPHHPHHASSYCFFIQRTNDDDMTGCSGLVTTRQTARS